MPIIGMTDKVTNVSEGLPRLGKLRKGDPKTDKRPGKDLDYFRFTPEPEFAPHWDAWKELHGETPALFKGVYLVGDSVDDVFPTWLEWWTAGEKLKIRTDGITVVQEYLDNKNKYSFQPRMVTPEELENCKEVGRMNLIMPEFIRAIKTVGVVTVETHSKNDIIMLYKYLSSIMLMYGKLTGVPFNFGRIEKRISTPREGGQRVMISKSLFTIDVDDDFTVNRLLPGINDAMLAAPAHPQIAAHQGAGELIITTNGANAVEYIARPDAIARKEQSTQPRRLTGEAANPNLRELVPRLDISGDDDDDSQTPEEYKGVLTSVRHATDYPGSPLRFMLDNGHTINVHAETPAVSLLHQSGWSTKEWFACDNPKKTFEITIEVGYMHNRLGFWELTHVFTTGIAPHDVPSPEPETPEPDIVPAEIIDEPDPKDAGLGKA